MKEREHSHSEIAKANLAERLGYAEKLLDIQVVINKHMQTKTHKEKIFKL